MRLIQNIYLEQQQKLMMTPELCQAIAILQMSSLELAEFIQAELIENPFLEEKETEVIEEVDEAEVEQKNSFEEWIEYFSNRDSTYDYAEMAEEKSFDNLLKKNPTLYEHLEFQLQLACNKQDELIIGAYLIGNIDSNGYLVAETEEVAARLQVDKKHVEEVLQLIQSFHPHGVGARNLAECLMLQYKHYGWENELFEMVIQDHLEDIARGSLNKIALALKASVLDVQKVCDLIRTLNPKPGLEFAQGNDDIKYILPDVMVEKINKDYVVIVNDAQHSRIKFNHLYEGVMRQKETLPEETVKYLEEKMNSAIWLMKSIEQRRMSIYKIAKCIVEIQRDFLEKGVKYLKPLTLKDVAEKVDVHESTVSRASNNKYIETPQGLFELKYFFSSAIPAYHTSEKVSSRSIKYMIKDIVQAENRANPLSDQAIVGLLARKNVCISRRTIAKYRQELGIQPALARKRYE